MSSSRLEAFSDGVLAIIITIMVLSLKAPEADSLKALLKVVPSLLAYVLSFVYVAIYWNNHHHLMKLVKIIDGKTLWFNNLWLFFISLIPWATEWVSRFHTSSLPVFIYGITLLGTAISYFILQSQVIKLSPKPSLLKEALGSDIKGKISLAIYIFSVIIAFYSVVVSELGYLSVALIWFIPDKRVVKVLEDESR
ncbi:TMEM175 family protein [Streptococcus dysgalactiae]|uniref:TMEM175 family protein n=1 Tax=Streptococcus dysgalactiae TaxID=1334 RepID=UPI0010CAAD1E|nr:TMEM175 family protein [Streptococcus dysgalactiae]VTT09805.1 membrane protein [Streptococcus dysgalactiae]